MISIHNSNNIERAIAYGEEISPYDTNLTADLRELSQEDLAKLKKRQAKMKPVLVKRNKNDTSKGIFKTN